MPYNPDTHKITGAVGLHDIARALGAAKDEELRDHANINIWNKCKPIRFYLGSQGNYTACFRELTDAERIGHSTEISQGYYYGVKLAGATGKFDEAHDVQFLYHEVRGLSNNPPEAFRATDFVGYNSEATANLYGTMPSTKEGYIDLAHGMDFWVEYQDWNTDGLDYASVVLEAMKPSTAGIQNCYPVLVVSNKTRSWTYVAALFCSDTDTATPLYYQNAWRRNFYAKLSALDTKLKADGEVGLTVGDEYYMTLCLYPGSDTAFSYTGGWIKVTSDSLFSNKIFALPGCVKEEITIKSYDNTPVPYLREVTASVATGVNIWTGLTPNPPGVACTLTPYIRINGVETVGTPVSVTASGMMPVARITWNQLQIDTPYVGMTLERVFVRYDIQASGPVHSTAWAPERGLTVTVTA